MASELEYVSSDWVAVELRAVAVVLSECACGREITAYHRSAVSSFGEHGCMTWRVEAGAISAVATHVPLARRTCRLLAAFRPNS